MRRPPVVHAPLAPGTPAGCDQKHLANNLIGTVVARTFEPLLIHVRPASRVVLGGAATVIGHIHETPNLRN